MMLAFLFIFVNGINFSFATKQRAGQIEFHRTMTLRSGGHTHVGETLGEIESHQDGVAHGETAGLLVR